MRVLIAAILAALSGMLPAQAAVWKFTVAVTPNLMMYNTAATMHLRTHAGASCAPSITYNGMVPTSFRRATHVPGGCPNLRHADLDLARGVQEQQ